jgi:phosphoglycolate phosphatase-like HAD superfamily hydrolase
MHLIVFDVDGTLTRSTAVDAACYAQAVSEHLGARIDTNWSSYRHPTDAGILQELLERAGTTSPAQVDVGAVRRRFVDLLSGAFAADPGCCREVPGAAEFIQRLQGMTHIQLAIATGGWAESARLKLRHAEIAVNGIPFASSDDSYSRENILRLACQRATAQAGGTFAAVTYVGDGPWDLSAARSLGFRFVGIACDGEVEHLRSVGAPVVCRDFTDRDALLKQMLAGR